jgi:hypothetical protein
LTDRAGLKVARRGADRHSVLGLYIGDNLHYVPLNDAKVLQSLLHEDGSAEATALRRSLEAAGAAAIPDPLRLGPEDIAALRDVLCEDLFIGFPALTSLQAAVCSDYPGKGLEEYFTQRG